MLTFARLQSLVQAAAPANAAADLSPADIVNSAGEHLVNMRSWVWAARQSVAIGVTGSQAWTALPTDFAELIALDAVASAWAFYVVPYDHLLAARRAAAPSSHTIAAVVWPDQATDTTVPAGPRLELFPTPTATVAEVARLFYRAKWKTLTKPNQVPNVPEYLSSLLQEMVQQYARGLADGSLSERLEMLERGPLFRAAAQRDGMQSGSLGISGGAVPSAQNVGITEWWDTPIVNPP